MKQKDNKDRVLNIIEENLNVDHVSKQQSKKDNLSKRETSPLRLNIDSAQRLEADIMNSNRKQTKNLPRM